MERLTFPDDFVWGAATASYQVEGAVSEGGRGESIWDRFCRTPGKVFGGHTGDVACDQYHRYEEDVGLMDELGLNAYRFSISWPRILPSGTGAVNQEGIEYYKRLIASLRKKGIRPMVTLYHWDLPQVLQDAGGWAARETAYAYLEYAKVCFEAFDGLVDQWVTFNEPLCTAILGYLIGVHAPGICDREQAYRAVHHLNLAHGLASKAFREGGFKGSLGIVWNLGTPRPARRRAEDRAAADFMTDGESRLYCGPVLGKGYPESWLEAHGIALPVEPGDLEIIASGVDFIGLNYYTEGAVRRGETLTERRFEPSWERKTAMGWTVVPRGLLRQLRWIAKEAPGIPLYVSENGCAEHDELVVDEQGNKRVHDSLRIEYLRDHLEACSRAIAEGIPLKGYFVWSFMDNFEWAFGYDKRFGILYVDYDSLERVRKDSFFWYRDCISGALE